MNNCTANRIMNPEEIFKAAWIRPEDLEYYVEEVNITNFKISGRSKTPEWTKRCLRAYLDREYDGNLMDILGTTPPDFENNSEQLFYINNKKLDDFLFYHPKNCNRLNCETCNYCRAYAIKLFSSGDFKINRICGEYKVVNGKFVCENGKYLNNLVELVEKKAGL